jgi:hypothetical protein
MPLTKVTPIMTTMETTEEKTWYVNASSGSDTNDGTTAGTAFETIQHAIDQLPPIIKHEQTIQLADGVYNKSSRAAADMPRPAIVYPQGKVIAQRTAQDGSDLEGMIVIKGTSKAGTIIENNPTDGYTYTIYISRAEIAIQDLTVRANTSGAAASSLLTAHRTGYAHCRNVDFDGQGNATFGVILENKATGELISCNVTNCATGVACLGTADALSWAHQGTDGVISNCTLGLSVSRGGAAELVMLIPSLGDVSLITGCTQAIVASGGSTLFIRGNSPTSRVAIDNPIRVFTGSTIEVIWGALKSGALFQNATARYQVSDFAGGMTLQNSFAYLSDVKSYIAPATANTAVKPINIEYSSEVFYAGTNDIVGLTGGPASMGGDNLVWTADSQVQAFPEAYNSALVTGGTANRLLCEIDSTDVPNGRVIYVTGDSWSVEFNGSGTHMEFDTNFSVGTSIGNYSGAVFMMQNGKWRLVSLGEVRT